MDKKILAKAKTFISHHTSILLDDFLQCGTIEKDATENERLLTHPSVALKLQKVYWI